MPDTLKLSAAAIMALRFEIKGWKAKDPSRRLPAYRELAAAGIMEPVSGSDAEFRFTEDGMARREDILREQEDRIERERYEPPVAGNLSDAARNLLRRRALGEDVRVDEETKPPYRELVAARIMIPRHSFAGSREDGFVFTHWGYRMRFDLAGIDREAESA